MTPLWQSSKLGNDEKTGTDPSRGVWGGIATYEANGRRFFVSAAAAIRPRMRRPSR